jgi:tetratricopeptide (TPR) repeat protein
MADRYAYIPLIGLFVMAVWGFADLAPRWRASSKVLAAAAAAILAALMAVTRIQQTYWHDSVTLWSHALNVTAGNFVAEDNLGQALVTQGRYEEAVVHFRTAAQINAEDPISQLNIGFYENMQGRPQQAISRYEAVLRLTSDRQLRAHALVNLGSAYRTMGDYQRARENYAAALRLDPDSSLALMGMGLVLQRTGDLTDAVNYYSRAVASQPTDIGYLLLAQALRRSGHAQEAELATGEARRLSRDLNQAQQSVTHLLAE